MLLTICLVGTSESHSLPRNKTCSCDSKFKQAISRKANEIESNGTVQSFGNKKLNNTDTEKDDAHQNQHDPSYIISDGKIQSNLLSNIGAQITSYLNTYPQLSEAVKRMLYRLSDIKIPQIPQFRHKENIFVIPFNNFLHKIDEQLDDELTKSESFSKGQLREHSTQPKDNYSGDSRNLNTDLHLSEALLKKMLLSHRLDDKSIPQFNEQLSEHFHINIPKLDPQSSGNRGSDGSKNTYSDDDSNTYYNIYSDSNLDTYVDTDFNLDFETDSETSSHIHSGTNFDEIVNYLYYNKSPKHNFPNYYDNNLQRTVQWPQTIPLSEFVVETQQRNVPKYRKTLRDQDLGYNNNFNDFDKQIYLLNNENQGPDTVDTSHLGHSFLRILTKNGIKDNKLADTYGSVPNTDTLNFTPVMIGNTMSLRHILQKKYGVLSSKLQTPYLQAILVSATHPQKILGIVFFGTTYLPLSASSDVTNSWKILKNSPKSEVLDREKLKQDQFNFKPRKNNYDENIKKYRQQSINIISDSDITKNSEQPPNLNKILSRPDYTGTEDDNEYNRLYHKKFSSQNFESNKGRTIMPNIEFRNQPIDILTRPENKSGTVIASKNHKPTTTSIHPDVSSLDNDFAGENTSVLIESSQDIPAKISNGLMISNDIKKNTVSKALHKPYLLKDNLGKSIAKKVEPDGLFQRVATQGFETIPFGFYSAARNILDEEMNIERSGVASESKILPDNAHNSVVPPKSDISHENSHNGNSAFEVIENDDINDGDFRIIGGNAATGSGTPLSNKGRSGFLF